MWQNCGTWAIRTIFVCVCALVTINALGSLAASDQNADGRAQRSGPELPDVELRALAAQSTLRVAAKSCAGLTRGSGFVVDGVVVTNRHVVEGAARAKVDQPVAPMFATVIAASASMDIATLEAPASISLRWADTQAAVGDVVMLAGHGDGAGVEVLEGLVIGRFDGGAYGQSDEVLMIDAVTVGGFSGGPVLDARGTVVGVLQGFDHATGLTIAIPSDLVDVELQNNLRKSELLMTTSSQPMVCISDGAVD